MLLWKKKINSVLKLADCIDCERGRSFLIIGAGGTLREYSKRIKGFIQRERPVTIGINKMTEFHVPDYHLWTNKQRYRDFGSCISAKSRMMFGGGMPEKLIRKHFKGDYIVVDYAHSLREACLQSKIKYKEGKIYGRFRTAGSLAIMIALLFGAKDIYVVGMDGFTLHSRKDVEGNNRNQHCYGKGFTDDASWEECIEKDHLVYENLRAIDAYGAKFRIITPTKFQEFYDSSVLNNFLKESD